MLDITEQPFDRFNNPDDHRMYLSRFLFLWRWKVQMHDGLSFSGLTVSEEEARGRAYMALCELRAARSV